MGRLVLGERVPPFVERTGFAGELGGYLLTVVAALGLQRIPALDAL
jgi:hypothetical protein